MKTLNFSVTINAPKEKVWNALWDEENYKKWTSVFHEGSYAESDWQEGSKILFLAPGGSGMYSIIDKKILNKQMTFKHLGEIQNSVEQPSTWENALESYYITENNGTTELKAELSEAGEHEQYFQDTFPKALDAVKQIAEA